MYVRLAFAVAAHLESEILIVDEVLAVGDAEFQKKCLGKMGEVSRGQGRTVLFVSHNMGSVQNLCTHVIQLDKGKFLEMGSAKSVISNYLLQNLKVGENIIDLSTKDRVGDFGTRAKITKISFNNGSSIIYLSRLEVKIYFEAYTKVDGLVVAMAFSYLDGTRIVTIDSDLAIDEPLVVSVEGGQRQIAKFSWDNFNLQPGIYSVDLALRTPDGGSGFDYIINGCQVEVFPDSDTNSHLLNNVGSGGIRISTKWEIEQ